VNSHHQAGTFEKNVHKSEKNHHIAQDQDSLSLFSFTFSLINHSGKNVLCVDVEVSTQVQYILSITSSSLLISQLKDKFVFIFSLAFSSLFKFVMSLARQSHQVRRLIPGFDKNSVNQDMSTLGLSVQKIPNLFHHPIGIVL
jgi:hypothetical protein